MIDISVIVVTYNSEWDKVKLTLTSIIKQKGVSLQIVVADDGSKEKFDDKINQLMNSFEFTNFAIIDSPNNRGTVLNISNALKYAKGEYTKTIAPGDYLYDESTLSEWVEYMRKEGITVSFGDAIYYSEYNHMKVYQVKGSPANKEFYNKQVSYSKQFIDYVVANDTILGAAQLMRTDMLKEYLKIIENRIVYAEDYMMRIMIYDGINICYYPQIVIWYEYGTGISTSQNSKWEKLLHEDFEASNEIILQRKAVGSIQKKYKKYLSYRDLKYLNKIIKVLYFPGMISCRLKMKFAKSYTQLGENIEIAKWIES